MDNEFDNQFVSDYETTNALDNIYSCLSGIFPLYFSNDRVLTLSSDDVLTKEGQIDFKSLAKLGRDSNQAYYDSNAYPDAMGRVFIEGLKKKKISNVSDVRLVTDFIKNEAKKYQVNEFRMVHEDLCDEVLDAIVPIDKKVMDNSSIYVDDFANRLKYVFADYKDFLLYERYLIKSDFDEEISDDWEYCDVVKVYDKLTDKNYYVAICDIDPMFKWRDKKDIFDKFVMKKVRDGAGYVNFGKIPREKRLDVAQNYGGYVVLGEEGGKFNPFSFLPFGFEGKTLCTNYRTLSPAVYGDDFTDCLFSVLDTMRKGAVRNVDYIDAVERNKSIEQMLESYYCLESTLSSLFDYKDKDWKSVIKLLTPNPIQNRIETSSKKTTRNAKIYSALKRMHKRNKDSMQIAVDCADIKRMQAEETKSKISTPFKEYI